MDLGLREAYFDHRLVKDTLYIIFGAMFILVCMYLFIGSWWITFASIAAIGMSLGVAYFVYTVVLGLTFFPFMNMMAVVVLLGIGADDVFIYMSVWKTVLRERQLPAAERSYARRYPELLSVSANSQQALPDDFEAVIAVTLRSAGMAMGVTSLTTGLAFLTTALSSITAIKCFG